MANEFTERPWLKNKATFVELLERVFQLLTLVFVVVAIFTILDTLEAAESSRERLVDCTTPEGECYEESQRRTGEAIKRIYEDGIAREVVTRATVVAAVACSKEYTNIVDIQNCVDKEIKQ